MKLANVARRYGRHNRSEEHTSELQSQSNLVCRLLLEKKKKKNITTPDTIVGYTLFCTIHPSYNPIHNSIFHVCTIRSTHSYIVALLPHLTAAAATYQP